MTPRPRFAAASPLLRALGLAVALAGAQPVVANDCMLGELRLFAGNFAPRNWEFAAGQILSVPQNTALYSILGITYGGNGTSTFHLPDLRGRMAVGVGQTWDVSQWSLGEQRGSETHTLTASQLPPHTHSLNVAAGAPATTGTPGSDKVLAVAQNAGLYAAAAPTVALHGASVGAGNSAQPFSIQPPSLGMSYIICTAGSYPSRS